MSHLKNLEVSVLGHTMSSITREFKFLGDNFKKSLPTHWYELCDSLHQSRGAKPVRKHSRAN
jgi:hypothetical protein